jgi:prepilin-type N-terminal cleavage/methylation domain-containing protein
MKHIRSRTWPSLACLKNQDGFTIVELMVAITVFALLMAAAALGLNGALNLTRNNRSRAVAANLASQTVDNIQAKPFDQIPIGNSSTTFTVDQIAYTIETNTEWVGPTTLTSDCAGGSSANPAYLRASIAVSWMNMGGALPVTDQTLVTPPVGTFNSNSGNVGVMVLDRNAAPREGIPVTLNGPSGVTTIFTTTNGCAFFAYQDPGSYTMSLNLSGNVNDQGVATPTQTIAVVPGSTVQTQVNYDLAAILQLTMVGGAGGAVPDGMPYTIANTGLLPGGTKRISGFGQTGPNRTLSSLYPYLSGYQVWAGSCLDADPQGQKPSPPGGAYYPGKVRDPALVTNPGATTVGNVNMPTMLVNVKKAGVPLAGATVKMVHAADVANGCTSAQTLTLVGTTDSNGNILAAMPFGLWTANVYVGATLQSPTGAWPSITLTPPSGTSTRLLNVAVN